MDLVYGKNTEVNFQEGWQLTEATNDEYTSFISNNLDYWIKKADLKMLQHFKGVIIVNC